MTTLEILQAARQLIEQPEHWTQGVSARDKKGAATFIYSEDAVAFCAMGATAATCRGKSNRVYDEAMLALERSMGDDIAIFNDSHTHSQVLLAFNTVIATLQTEEVLQNAMTAGILQVEYNT